MATAKLKKKPRLSKSSISICSLAFGLITRWITKWTQWVGGLCQLYKFPDPGGDVVGPAYVGLYGSSVLV